MMKIFTQRTLFGGHCHKDGASQSVSQSVGQSVSHTVVVCLVHHADADDMLRMLRLLA